MQYRNGKRLAIALAIAVVSVTTLPGCSSSEDRQAKYMERAQVAYDAGDYEKARVDLKNVLQINQGHAQARLLVAKLEEKAQNWPQMFANLSAAIDADPTFIDARIEMARLMLASGQLDKVDEQIDAVLQQQAGNADALGIRAAMLARQQQPEQAKALCQQILASNPGHPAASGLLAGLYAEQDIGRALTIVDEGIRHHPDDMSLQQTRIHLLIRNGDSARATAALQQLTDQHPESLQIPSQFAAYLSSQKQDDAAQKVLRAMIERNPDADRAKLIFIDFLAKRFGTDQALRAAQQFVERMPDNYALQTALVDLHLARGDAAAASSVLRQVIDGDRKSTDALDARNRLARIALSESRRADADQLIADNLDIEPENGDALLLRARLALADNQPDKAIGDLRTVLKNSPNSAPALELIAAAQERSGASSLALDNYQQLLQVDGSNLAALKGAGRLLAEQQKVSEAQQLLEKAYRLAPSDYETNAQLIELLTRQQAWERSLTMAAALTADEKSAAAGHYLTGLILDRKGERDKAIAELQTSLTLQPQSVEPLQALLRTYVTAGRVDDAIAYANRHVEKYPQQLHARELLAALYEKRGRFADAERILRDLIAQQPARISAYRTLASVLIGSHQQQAVIPMLEQGLKQNPDAGGLMLMLAETYQASGDNAQALALYERLNQQMPHSDVVRNNLALMLAESASDEDLRRAMALTEDFNRSENPLFLDTLGWIHVKSGNYPQAVSLLEDAVRRSPEPELHYHLGIAYLRSNMADKAREQLQLAVRDDTRFAWRADAESQLSKLQ